MSESIELFKILNEDYEKAIEKVTASLKVEGFGILTEIDVKETFKKKLNVEFERYIILGACNPPLAKKALDVDRSVGALLPCNVYVQELAPNKTKVSAINPLKMFEIFPTKEIESIAIEVNEKLIRVINSL